MAGRQAPHQRTGRMAIFPCPRYDAGMTKRRTAKPAKSADAAPPKDTRGSDFDAQMSLAEEIMRDDREVLSALAQMSVAREVMSRRRRALRDLSR